jgi:DNA-binding LytR/AlgR family response regulator
MKRFVVCDDDIAFVEQLASMLHACYSACTVEHMYGPEALEASLREDSSGADVLLVDIELRGKSSIDLIKKYLKPSSPLQIIYVTGYMHYCTAVYDTKHCSFLVKPITLETLRHAVELALAALERDRETGVSVKTNGGVRIVYIPSLLYAESHGRCLSLVSDEERVEIYEKMDDFRDGLDRRFVSCHKSYLVNMDRVRQFCGNVFIMDNGQTIPISQTRRKEVREIFARYMGGLH